MASTPAVVLIVLPILFLLKKYLGPGKYFDEEGRCIYRISYILPAGVLLLSTAGFVGGISLLFLEKSGLCNEYHLDIILGLSCIFCLAVPFFIFSLCLFNSQVIIDNEKIIVRDYLHRTKVIHFRYITEVQIIRDKVWYFADSVKIIQGSSSENIGGWIGDYEDMLNSIILKSENAQITENSEVKRKKPTPAALQPPHHDSSALTICVKCGYQRKPADDLIAAPFECPRCGIIYSRAKVSRS